MLSPDMILLLWVAALALIALLLPVLVLDVRSVSHYHGRHVRVPGTHRQDPDGAGWWWQPPERTWTSGYGKRQALPARSEL